MPEGGIRGVVYVVDDEEAVADSLRMLLGAAGIRVQTYTRCDEFLAAFGDGEAACLLVDARMPDMPGHALLREVRRRGYEVPAILMSGDRDAGHAGEFRSSDLHRFLAKPFSEKQLLGAVNEALQRARERCIWLHTWALILAAGSGRRLASLTRTPSGLVVPKQYCSLWGGKSLLQEALLRAGTVVARDRVCAIVAADHRRWWSPSLWSIPKNNRFVQPADRGTGIGVLLCLMHVLERDPDAHVLVLPSAQHVADEAVLADAMRSAIVRSGEDPRSIVLLGFEPDSPDSGQACIVRDGQPHDDGTFQVVQLVEEPEPELARRLIEQRALWNGLIVAASARALLDLYTNRYGAITDLMGRVAARDTLCPEDGAAASAVYDQLPRLDFSRDVLQGAESRLRTLPVADCGWSDLGYPATVQRVTQRGSAHPAPAQDPWGMPTLCTSAQSFG